MSPEGLAAYYERFVADRTAGAPEAERFAAWLESHWMNRAAPEPGDPPAAVSQLGGFGAIRWRDGGSAILGYPVEPARGCCWAPRQSAPPGHAER